MYYSYDFEVDNNHSHKQFALSMYYSMDARVLRTINLIDAPSMSNMVGSPQAMLQCGSPDDRHNTL